MPRAPEHPDQPELPLFESPAGSPAASAASAASAGAVSRPARRSLAPPPRTFPGWDRPLLALAAERLARDWHGRGPLDLSNRLVVVPTRNAGRRLREALAIRAAEEGSGVFPPLVVTPDFLFSAERLPPEALDPPPATPARALLVWTGLLRHIELDEFRRLFPVDPVERSLAWASETAASLLEVRRLLVESGHLFATAAVELAEHGIETGRWEELARLERLAASELRRCGLADEGALQRRVPEEGRLPPEVRSVLVCGVPDLRPLAAAALERCGAEMPVEILVHAPESEAAAFDLWGRPGAETWADREIPFEDPESRLHPAADPAEQAAIAVRLLAGLPDPASMAAVGLPDASLAAPLAERLAAEGLGAYDPGGRSLRQEGVYHLLKTLGELVETGSFAAFRRLLDCPGVAEAWLRNQGDNGVAEPGEPAEPPSDRLSPAGLIDLADQLAVESFPDEIDDAVSAARRRFAKRAGLAVALERARELRRQLEGPDFEDPLHDFLAAAHSRRRFSHGDGVLKVLAEVSDAIHVLARDLAETAPAFRGAPPGGGGAIALLLKALAGRRIYPERHPQDLDLNGWLELAWEDAPRLVVVGMNDHCVPETVLAHAFLPDTARRLLGAPHNAERFARDAFLLAAMSASRRAPGSRLDLVFGRANAEGDPLRPSRLLFQCALEELPARTVRLFRETGSSRPRPARSVAFRLRPEPLPEDNPVFSRLSPTAIRQYLACPFRFYLRHGLRMEQVETRQRELDAAGFGNLVHDALEALGTDAEAARLADPGRIRAFLEDAVERSLSARFGRQLPLPVLIQRESARRRLAWWAEVEAVQRAEGWLPVESEVPFGTEERPLSLGGMTIRGRIDRVEEHDLHGLRVVDFKTHSTASKATGKRSAVEQYHLADLKRSQSPEDFPEWQLCEGADGKVRRWTDLQLPLYLLAMRARGEKRPLRAAHGTVGPSEGEVFLDEWADLDEALLASAERCAFGVVEAVRAQRFWPPSEDAPPWDAFAEILAPSAVEAVAPFPEG